MELYQIEKASTIIYALCRNHPELCPHDYEWHWSKTLKDQKQNEEHYICNICGHEQIRYRKME